MNPEESSPEAAELSRRLVSGETVFGQLRVIGLTDPAGTGNREPAVRIEGPGTSEREAPGDPLVFRAFVRLDDEGRYRPLTGARTLRSGWWIDCRDVAEATERVEWVYPLALRHAAQALAGTLRVVGMEEALGRQTGDFAAAAGLRPDQRRRAVEALCGLCVRCPVWDQEPKDPDQIPCPEPCNLFIGLAAAVADFDGVAAESEDSNGVDWADFSAPRNPIMARFRMS